MKKRRLRKISAHQTALSLSIANGLIAAFASTLSMIQILLTGTTSTAMIRDVIMLTPVCAVLTYAAVGMVSVAYNMASKYTGGIEVEMDD